jgi:hypothetical protein
LQSLSKRFDILSDLHRLAEALPVIQEATNLFRRLTTERPTVVAGEFKSSLSKLSRCYAEMGQPEDALRARTEAESVSQWTPLGHGHGFDA